MSFTTDSPKYLTSIPLNDVGTQQQIKIHSHNKKQNLLT